MCKLMCITCDRYCKRDTAEEKGSQVYLEIVEQSFLQFKNSWYTIKRISDAAEMCVIKLIYRIMDKIGYSVSSLEFFPSFYSEIKSEFIVCKMFISIRKIRKNICFLVSLLETPTIFPPWVVFQLLSGYSKVNLSSEQLMAVLTSEESQGNVCILYISPAELYLGD